MYSGWQAQRQQQADADHEASSGNAIHGFFNGIFDGFFSGRGTAGTYQDPSTASALPGQQRLQATGQIMQPQPLAVGGGGTSSSYAPQQSQYLHQPQQQPIPQQQVLNHSQSHMPNGMGTGPMASGQVLGHSASGYPARQQASPQNAGASGESFYSFFAGIFQPGQGANASVKPEDNQINGAQAGSHPSRNVNDSGYQHSGNAAQVLDRSGAHKVDNNVSRERDMSPGRNRGVSPTPCRQASQQQCDREDILDQHVAYFLRHNPEVQKNVSCVRKRPGVYEVEGREVTVEWQYSEEPGGQGYLIVLDGPTPFAPFADFMKGQSSAKKAQKAQSQATGHGTNCSYTPPPVMDPAYGGYGPSAAGTPAANTHQPSHGRGGTACGLNEQIPPEAFVPAPVVGGPPIVDVGGSKPKGTDQTGRELSIGQQSTTFGGSNAESNSSGRKQSKDEYGADMDDLLDQHVAYYLRHNPDVHTRVQTVRKSPGVYVVNGREVFVEWQSATTSGGQGFLVAVDGPLRQPFAHYMKMSEADAEYDSNGIRTAPLHTIPKEKRLTFGDQGNVYTRLDAMKVAKAQAQYRERAADFVHQGQQVPVDIMQKYEKTLQQKLGGAGKKKNRPPSQAPPPAHTPAGGGGCTAGYGGGGVGGPLVPPAGAMGSGQLGGPQLMLGGGQVMGDRSATAGLQQPMLGGQAHHAVRQGTPAHPGFPGASPLMPFQQPSMSRSGGSGRLPPGHPAPYAGFRP